MPARWKIRENSDNFISSDSQTWNSSKGQAERVGQLYTLRGKNQEQISSVPAGDIGAVTKLSIANLPAIDAGVAKPSYRRDDLTPGIVHVGVGNFHRAHQAIYLHRLFETGRDLDWAIIGGGVKPYDAAMRSKLKAQDWLTTVVELDPDGFSAGICGSMVDFTEVDPKALIGTMTGPEIRIVSLTITEGGYCIDDSSGVFLLVSLRPRN